MCYKVSRTAMAQVTTATAASAAAEKRGVQGGGDALGAKLLKGQCKSSQGCKGIFHNTTVRGRY